MMKNQIDQIWLILLILLHCFLCIDVLNPEKDIYTARYPCETECAAFSSAPCDKTPWRNAAVLSRKIPYDCEYVLYSVSLGYYVDGLIPIPDFWRGKNCSIVFMSDRSKLVERLQPKQYDKLMNWTMIFVKDFSRSFENNRRAGKIPKLSPSYFFTNKKIQYVMYLDSKYILKINPKIMITKYLALNSNILLSALIHPKHSNITMEMNGISEALLTRPTITSNYSKILDQYQQYQQTNLFQQMARQQLNQTIIDAGMLLHKLHDRRSQQFRCAWLQQIQQFSDRDQIAFPFVTGWFNHNQSWIIRDHDFVLVPLVYSNDSIGYIHLIPKIYSWKSGSSVRFGALSRRPWHDRVEITLNQTTHHHHHGHPHSHHPHGHQHQSAGKEEKRKKRNKKE